jgi:hypothetical protein
MCGSLIAEGIDVLDADVFAARDYTLIECLK